jgi:hypothetical protein
MPQCEGRVFAARVQFVLCGLATIYLTASTTIYGVPTEGGCVSSGRVSRVLWAAEMDELYYEQQLM